MPSGREARPLPDGVPCSHPGCLSHISHPCEGCGRIGGRRPELPAVLVSPDIRLPDEVVEAIQEKDRRIAALERELAKHTEPVLRPTMQMLIDAGLNGFAFELVSESLAGKKDIKTFNRLRFEFRGVIYTLEPVPQAKEGANA